MKYEKKKKTGGKIQHDEEKTLEPNPIPEVGSTQNELLNNIMELKRKIEGKLSMEPGESPVTQRLESESKQRHLKHPNLKSSYGIGDDEEHLSYFEQLALLYEYRDHTRCRFFASNLRGNAKQWFCRLSPQSLDT